MSYVRVFPEEGLRGWSSREGVLREIHQAKLAWQFPGRRFCVSLYEPEDVDDLQAYEITFWQESTDVG